MMTAVAATIAMTIPITMMRVGTLVVPIRHAVPLVISIRAGGSI